MAPFLPAPGRFLSWSSPAARSTTLLLLLLSVAPGRVALAQVRQPPRQDTAANRRLLERSKAQLPPMLQTPVQPPAPARIAVPDVTGLPLPEAIQRLARVGLKVGPVDSVQSAAPAGSVVSQWPAAGSMLFVRALARYVARLSLATPAPGSPASQTAIVPDLAGLTLDEARGLLERTRLRPGNVTSVPGEAPAGTVVGQTPAAGTSLDPGSGVDIQVSTGPQQVVVPGLFGRTVAEAVAALAGLPLRIERVDSVATIAGNGTVVRQYPPAGSQVPPGTGITLGVATSPGEPLFVPDLRGDSLGRARARLDSLGLVLALGAGGRAKVAPGTIIAAQRPPAGASVSRGSVVEVDLAPPARTPPWALILTAVVLALAAAQGLWRWRKRPPAVAETGSSEGPGGSPAPASVELNTTWDFGSTSLEVEGPLEAGPALHLVAHGNPQERVVALEHDQPLVAGGDHE
jgi:beta-lactam-binding protein with PASTA domain